MDEIPALADRKDMVGFGFAFIPTGEDVVVSAYGSRGCWRTFGSVVSSENLRSEKDRRLRYW